MTTIDQHRPNLPAPAAASPLYDLRHGVPAGPPEAEEPGLGEMLMRLHMMMRGRYLVSILLALLLGGGLGYLGFRVGERTYRSTGQIRIVPTLPRIMYETEDKGVMPMFDSFVQTQVSLIRTQRVTEIALEDRDWPSPPPRDNAAVADFMKRLNVLRENELIAITYDAAEPVFAQHAVKAVINAYRKLYIEADGRENEQVLNQLTQRQAALNNELASNLARIRAIAEHYNTDEIGGIFLAQQTAVQDLEQKLADVRQKQADYERQMKRPGGVTAESLAATDDTLAGLLKAEQDQSLVLDRLRAVGRAGVQNPAMVEASTTLAVLRERIAARVAEASTKNGGGQSALAEEFTEAIARLNEQLTTQQQSLKNIGQDQFQLADLKRDGGAIAERLSQTKQRIEALNTEAPVSTGRVTIISEGDRPLVPAKDTRIPFAALGGLVGLCVPFGVALLLSGTNRKYGTPVETRMSSITRDLVLGALPEVKEDVFNPESSTLAAHCLHQVRTMLQIRCNGSARAIAITSPRAGSGKTSVVLGLGVSYAMAGSRTLLIDLDLVGGGLTRRAEIQARARLGNLLIEQGLITDEQLQHALEVAKEKQIKLGEAFVDAGHLSAAQLDAILSDQRRSHAGLMDALHGNPLAECVSNAGMANLDILPLGAANPHDAATLSPRRDQERDRRGEGDLRHRADRHRPGAGQLGGVDGRIADRRRAGHRLPRRAARRRREQPRPPPAASAAGSSAWCSTGPSRATPASSAARCTSRARRSARPRIGCRRPPPDRRHRRDSARSGRPCSTSRRRT